MLQFRRMDTLVVAMNEKDMILAMPGNPIKCTNKQSSPQHFNIMLAYPIATEQEFADAVDKTTDDDLKVLCAVALSVMR